MPTEAYNHACRIIDEIMTTHGIPVDRHASYEIRADSTFTEVVQYTRRFCVPIYRYSRYKRILELVTHLISPNRHIAHLDIGCGPGLFTWAVLDWAVEKGIGNDRIDLCGYDRSEEMITLATLMSDRLSSLAIDSPSAQYHYDSTVLLQELTTNSHQDTDYLITLGYVLAGNHTDSDLDRFAQIIKHISDTKSNDAFCLLVASDAIYKRNIKAGWEKLMQVLQEQGIAYEEVPVPVGYTGDRCVLVYS